MHMGYEGWLSSGVLASLLARGREKKEPGNDCMRIRQNLCILSVDY